MVFEKGHKNYFKGKSKKERLDDTILFRVNRATLRRLYDYTDVTGIHFSKLIRRLLLKYFKSDEYKKEVKPFDDYRYDK